MVRGRFLLLSLDIIALLLALTSSAWSNESDLLFEAENNYYDKHYRQALGQSEKALLLNPASLPATILKARIHIALNEADQAVALFEKAIQLGADSKLFLIELAQARNQAGLFDDNIRLVQPDNHPPDIAAGLYTELGYAYFGNHENIMADAAFTQALEKAPRSAAALTGRAAIALSNKNYPEAVSLLQTAIAEDPYHHRAYYLLGQLEYSRQQLDSARSHFQRAYELQPLHIATLVSLAASLTDLNETRQAITLLSAAAEQQPWVPHYHYLLYVNHTKTGQQQPASEALQQARNIFDALTLAAYNGHPQDLLLASMVFKSSGDIQKSLSFNERFLRHDPSHYGANKLNAALLLATGNYRQAISRLQGIVRYNSHDASVYTAIGDAYIGAKLYPTAIKSYKEALLIEPDSPRIHQRLAFAHFINSDNRNALQHAQQAIDHGGQPNPLFMALLHHATDNNTAAISLSDSYLETHPQNQLAQNLKAALQMKNAQPRLASEILESIVEQAPDNLIASLNLATGYRLSNRLDASKNLLLSMQPLPQVQYALAVNAYTAGNAEEAIRHMLRINLSAQQNLKWSLFLLDLYINSGQLAQASNTYNDINRYFPRNPLLMIRLAQIELRRNSRSGAKSALNVASTNAGYNAAILYTVAWQQTAAGFHQDAIYTLNKALIGNTDNHNLLILLARNYLLIGEFDQAEASIRRLLGADPENRSARILLADIDFSRGNFSQALAQYQALLEDHPLAELVVSTARTHSRLGHRDKAISLLRDWHTRMPGSVLIKWQLARYYLMQNSHAEALELFLQLESLLPEDAMVMNNIAVLLTDSDPEKAQAYAEKALQLKPDHAQLIDTHAWILLKRGEKNQALRLLRDAIARDTSSAVIQYHLGVALQDNDKPQEAIKHLQSALNGKLDVQLAEDAKRRLQQLKRSIQ